MSAGIPYGLPTDLSPEDMARLFGKAPMGAPQSFSGTSGTVQPEPQAPAPAPLALRVSPRPASVEPPQAGGPVLPDFKPADLPAGASPSVPMGFRPPMPPPRPSDMPSADSAPVAGTMPALAAAPAAAPGVDGGFDFGGALKRFTDRGGGDLLVGLGTGLMSTHGFGNGLAAGFQNAQKAEQQRAVTGLAQAELGIKQRKLAQENAALGGNASIIKRAFPNLSEAEAISAGSNSGQVTEALRILRDPNHGTGVPAGYRQRADGQGYEPIPGSEADPATKEALAAAAARGAASGKPDETFTLIPDAERATLGLPAGSYQRDSKGKVSAVNPTGTTINMGAEKAQDATVGKGYGEYQLDLATKGRNSASTLNTLALMEQAMKSPGFYSGVGGEGVKRANQFLGALGVKDSKAASAAEVFDALSNKVVLDGLGGSLGPGISNTDRDYIARTAPTLAQSEQGNRDLIGVARALAQRQQAVSKLARDYAGRNGGRLDSGFDQALDEFATSNPLFPQARAGEAASAPKEPPQGAPQGARQARDGNWYAPDPSRPGKYLKVQ
ncbi:hypothetical protein [Methylobacterium sp. E-045]|uniref:hypothetical protein n=1 Tax=Methylobacterium sp. E-045 TaxID=2836575 RepID=UPI001FBA7065|nr:hypothetical protein [Methylobacterium sp. E-045]MCJ2127347.1 hypothetical protein [Methylobacterium sp. E-045]